eukprot:Skav223191  [mRNA]  locus=scaffold1825:72118:74161:- [translate_table: standard]
MCSEMKELFLNEPSLLELHAPLVISAHFTGSLDALNYVFNTCGEPGPTSHLFLGNYVSRGRNGLEVLTLLLCYKKKFPAQVHLLRGKQPALPASTGSMMSANSVFPLQGTR